MRTAACLLLLSLPGFSLADDAKTTTTWKFGDHKSELAGKLGTTYEGMVIALLGSCGAEQKPVGGVSKERWEKTLKEDHIRIRFAKPRSFALCTNDETPVEVEEIIVDISTSGEPQAIMVRNGEKYRAFAKYDGKICGMIQHKLKDLQQVR